MSLPVQPQTLGQLPNPGQNAVEGPQSDTSVPPHPSQGQESPARLYCVSSNRADKRHRFLSIGHWAQGHLQGQGERLHAPPRFPSTQAQEESHSVSGAQAAVRPV